MKKLGVTYYDRLIALYLHYRQMDLDNETIRKFHELIMKLYPNELFD